MSNNSIITMFNDIAPTYDLLNRLFSGCCDIWWRRAAIRALQISSEARVLDVCTGTADLAMALTARYPAVQVDGVDFSANMLEHARRKLIRKHLEQRVPLLRGDALRLPFPDNTFDALLIGFGLRNLRDRGQGLREMQRVLKAAGQVVVLEFAPPPRSWFGWVYRLYLRDIMPLIGKIVSRSDTAYHYLYTSIDQFLEPAEIIALLNTVGFREITWQSLMFGLVGVCRARRLT